MKRYKNEELERPGEWLRRLREDPQLYGRLLDDAGSLALAAHRIACARCRTSPTAIGVPTGTEVHAAACEIQQQVPAIDRVPRAMDLAGDCDAAGIPVMGPPRAA